MTQANSWPNQQEHDFTIRDFRFESGEVLGELCLHYMTMGTAVRGDDGTISNAVLLLHNTTGSAATWLSPTLADELFGDGQALDLAKYFVVVPDLVGFGGSSKPSDGLRAGFPHYRYDDMVVSTYRLLTEGLGIDHLRLVLGISMGGMLAWIWGEKYPQFMDALVPVASQPGPMSGRNWIQRRVSIEAIRNDPEWNNGNYEANPTRYVVTAPFSGLLIQSVVRLQEAAPTREAGDELYRALVERAKKGDANNRLYQVEASMEYDPSNDLEKIKARVLAINFADDELNPPQLGIMEPAMARIPASRYVLVPAGPETNGHYSTLLASLWSSCLAEFMAELES